MEILIILSKHVTLIANMICTPDLCRKPTEEAKPEVHHGEGKVLVEEVAEESAHAQVRPAAVYQQEAL